MASEDQRIRLICQDNFGVCKARNVGMDHALGEYLFFLDADDALIEDAICKMYDLACQHHAEVVTGDFLYVFPDGTEKTFPFSLSEETEVWKDKEFLIQSLKDHAATHSACAKLYHRSVTNAVRFAEGKKIHEDSFYVFEVSLNQPKTVVINLPVERRFMHEKSPQAIEYAEKHTDILYFGKRKHQIIEENYPELLPLAKNIMVKAALATLNSVCLIEDPRVIPLEEEAERIVRSNAEFFIPASSRDKLKFWIVKLGFRKLYKRLYKIYLSLRK